MNITILLLTFLIIILTHGRKSWLVRHSMDLTNLQDAIDSRLREIHGPDFELVRSSASSALRRTGDGAVLESLIEVDEDEHEKELGRLDLPPGSHCNSDDEEDDQLPQHHQQQEQGLQVIQHHPEHMTQDHGHSLRQGLQGARQSHPAKADSPQHLRRESSIATDWGSHTTETVNHDASSLHMHPTSRDSVVTDWGSYVSQASQVEQSSTPSSNVSKEGKREYSSSSV